MVRGLLVQILVGLSCRETDRRVAVKKLRAWRSPDYCQRWSSGSD